MLPRIVWFLADGLSHELVRAYIAARPGARLASLWDAQRIRPLTPLAPNCQTPPSLFTIWSGYEADQHGLSGYEVPAAVDGDPTAFADGFQVWPRDLDMVWDLYARQHLNIRTCAVPFVQPALLAPWLLSATDVFGPPAVEAMVLGDGDVLSIAPPGQSMRVEADSRRIVLRDAEGRQRWRCELDSDQPPEPLHMAMALGGETHFALCLRAAKIDGQVKLICPGYHPVKVHGSAATARRQEGRSQPYVVGNPGKLYAAGSLGRRLDQGGPGQAERLLVKLMRDVHDSFSADTLSAIEADDADLVVGYYPVIDLLSHQVLRYAFGPDKHFDGPLADVFIEVMDWLDQLLVKMAERIGTNIRFIVNSDHGMTPVEWDIHPNVFFAERNWLQYDDGGKINPHRSLVFFHPAENGLLVFHPDRLREVGLTQTSVTDALVEAVAAAGVAGLSILEGVPAKLGAAWQASLYLQCPSGARPRAAPGRELVRPSYKGGDHTVYCPDPWLRGVLVDAGADRWLAPGEAALSLAQLLPLVTVT